MEPSTIIRVTWRHAPPHVEISVGCYQTAGKTLSRGCSVAVSGVALERVVPGVHHDELNSANKSDLNLPRPTESKSCTSIATDCVMISPSLVAFSLNSIQLH